MANIPSLSEIFLYQIELSESVVPNLQLLWQLVWTWGWIVLPFFLWPIVKDQWLFWRNDLFDETENKKMLLEVRIPGEILKPIRAMETVLTGFWQIYGPPNWFEEWWKGQYNYSFTMEIAIIDGVPHFLLRIPEKQRDMFEQHIYAQYPEAEVFEVEDYTNMVSKSIPNERWKIWGTDYTFLRSDAYPLKTYRDFETEREAIEEKRIDPMAALMEGASKMGEGEQMWITIKAKPITAEISDFPEKSKKMYEKIAGRKEKPPEPSLIEQISSTLFGYPKQKEVKEEGDVYPEMKLTPGEKDLVAGIENKRSKHLFDCFIRFVYLARKDKFSSSRFKIPMSYFNQFNNPGKGEIIPLGTTITKVKQNWYDWFWLIERRLYLKKRKMFRSYLRRVPFSFPQDKEEETFVLNAEELASIFHFPSRASSPPSVIPRVESRKKEAPHNLPVEGEDH